MARFASRFGSSLANFASSGLNLLFPLRCACCQTDLAEQEDHVPLCPLCYRRIVPEKWICCRHCGGAIAEESQLAEGCFRCKNPPLLFDTVVTIGEYDSILREIILQMKQSRRKHLAITMGRLLAQIRFRELAELSAEMIVPIPMYWRRRLRRGMNSPEQFARSIGQKLAIPVENRLLVRCRNTLPQSGLPRKQRFHNVRGAFRLRSHRPLQDARVLLVDDVLTTGATCSEVAGLLKKAGASMVAVAVIARAQGSEKN